MNRLDESTRWPCSVSTQTRSFTNVVPVGRSKSSLGRRRWAHGFLACSIPADSKSGQFKVRTFDKPQFWPLFGSMSGCRWRSDSIQIPAGSTWEQVYGACAGRGKLALLWIGNSVSIRSTTFRGILSHLLFFQRYRSDPRWLSNCQFSVRRVVVLLGLQLWLLRWMVAICRSQWNRK